MGASGAGAPNQPELPAAAKLPLVHPIALAASAASIDKGPGVAQFGRRGGGAVAVGR